MSKSVDEWINTFLNDIKQSIKECFAGSDISSSKSASSQSKNRGPGKIQTIQSSQNFRQKLWSSIEWLFTEEIYNICQQVILFQKCIKSINLIEENDKYSSLKENFLKKLESLLEQSFRDSPSHVAQCLQQSLPKLHAAIKSLQSKLDQNVKFGNETFKSLEAGYLEKCGSTLKASFAGTECPTEDSVDTFIRAASIELSAAMVNENLCDLIADVCVSVNKDFWNKTESYIKLGTDAQQVIDIPNAAQIQNTSIANTIFYHNTSIKRMISNLGSNFSNTNAAKKIIENLKDGEVLVCTILQQLLGEFIIKIIMW